MEKAKTTVFILLFLSLFLFLFLFYGPIDSFRQVWITSAMSSKSHQYLASLFFSQQYIDEVMLKNVVIEGKEVTRLSEITVKNNSEKLYHVEKIYGSGYSGYLVEIYDPKRIFLAASSQLGKEGELITEVFKREKARVAINAVGFYDPNWESSGAIPHGTVIQCGKVISQYGVSNVGGGFAGFTEDGKLFLGDVSVEEVLERGVKDAVQFGPFLIVNGKKSTVIGDGGFGLAPRTAIGQKKDGTVLFLVINGRIPSSIGASMKDLIFLMEKYGAYNAVNMDGGSSTALVVEGKVMNKPVGGGKSGLRKLPVFWMIK